MLFLLLLAFIITPVLYLRVGLFLGSKLGSAISTIEATMLGLCASLLSSFLLWHLGLPLFIAGLASLVPAFFVKEEWKVSVLRFIPEANINFLIWTITAITIGVTIIRTTNGIETSWTNNYGDVTFHLGMITNLVFGDNRTPEYHIFAGEKLTYPLLVNWWSAELWALAPRWGTLPLVFAFQWVFVWLVVYKAVRGDTYWFLPWIILLGGGSYLALGQNSGQLIPQNEPWTSFITTVWIPQRSAMLGVAGLLVAIGSFLDRDSEKSLYKSAVLLGLLPLVHAHFFLVGAGFCFIILFIDAVRQKNFTALTVWGCIVLALVLLSLYWILGKEGGTKLIAGWTTHDTLVGWARIKAALHIWFSRSSACVWLLSTAALFFITKSTKAAAAFLILFFLGETVQLAYWEWDQVKLFIGLYLVSFCVWSRAVQKSAWILHIGVLLPLVAPTVVELKKSLTEASLFEVYNKADVEMANAIRAATRPTDILVGSPDHNSLLTLVGRRMWYGYEGTLSSHGLDYGARQRVMKESEQLAECARSEERLCPNYLLWTPKELSYFKKLPSGASPVDNLPLYRLTQKQ